VNSDNARTTFRSEGIIMAAYLNKGWALSTVKKICQCVYQTGSAKECKAGCGRPKSALPGENIAADIFNAEKSLGGHVKKSITLSFFNRITFHLAVSRRTFQKIKLYNFKLKLQTVAEKTAKNFRGYFILLHPVRGSSRGTL